MTNVPKPEVVSCGVDESFAPALAAMHLRWPDDGVSGNCRIWHLPDRVQLFGPLPTRFGIRIHRTASDSYEVRMVWDNTPLFWAGVSRSEVMRSSLGALLAALGTDLAHLLEQPAALREAA